MLKILDHFKKAWEAYKTNFIPVIISMALIWIVFYLFFGLSIFSLLGTEGATNIANSYMMRGEPIDFESPEFLESVNIQNIGFFFLFLVLGLFVAIFLQAGFWGVCLNGVKKKVNIKTFFTTVRERGISYFLASLLVLLIIIAISIPLLVVFYGLFYLLQIILFIPIAYLIILFLIIPFFIFIPPAIIEGKSIPNSLSQSFEFGKKYYFDLILLMITLYVFSLISFIPIIGTLLIYFLIVPIYALLICSFYIKISRSDKDKIGNSKIKTKRKIKREEKTKKIAKTKKPVKVASKSKTRVKKTAKISLKRRRK